MPMFHPVYGDLLTAKEVSDATGHTINQLRNWRVKSRQHLAPFGAISLGGSAYYRQIVVQDWIDEHGRQDGEYFMTERDKKFPLNVAVEGDVKKRTAMTTLASINPETVSSWRDLLSKQDSKGVRQHLEQYAEPVYVSLIGEYDKFTRHITQANRFSEPVWFAGATKALRMYVNDRQNLGFSEEEIDAMPIGAYPPTKESKA